jgi:hypothetical protein
MMEPCPDCGAPSYITQEQAWLDNGDIVYKKAPWRRLAFLETENLDPIMRNVEELIGVSIEHIVMATYRKAVRLYLQHQMPDNINELVREGQVDLKSIIDMIADIGRVTGAGSYRYVDMRYERDEDDYYTSSVTEPYSVPLCASLHAAALEAVLGYEHRVVYLEERPGVYNITAYPERHLEEFEKRLTMQPYEHEEGEVVLPRCGSCGGPAALSDFRWDIENGVIINHLNRRRVALQGHNQLAPVFAELERELGESVPQVIVEAQRRYIRTGPYAMKDIGDEEYFRSQLAVRGLGNLQSLALSKGGLRMRVTNATMYLLIVGLVQGVFDKTYGVDTRVEWSFSPQRTLDVEVKPIASITDISEFVLPRGEV